MSIIDSSNILLNEVNLSRVETLTVIITRGSGTLRRAIDPYNIIEFKKRVVNIIIGFG